MFTGLQRPGGQEEAKTAQSEPKSRLARHVLNCFRRNSDFRISSGAEAALEASVRAYNMVCSPVEKAMFDRMGVSHETYDPIVRARVNNITALLTRVFVNQGKTHSVEPTPRPEVPESVTTAIYAKIFTEFNELLQATGRELTPEDAAQYAFKRYGEVLDAQKAWAAVRAQRMDTLVDDIFAEGGFNDVKREAIFNMAKTGTGVAIGPCETVEYGLRQRTGVAIGDVTFERAMKRRMRFFVPDTLDCFPSPGAKRADDGDLCVRVRFAPAELAAYTMRAYGASGGRDKRGADGWDVGAVKRVLDRAVTSGRMPEMPLPIDSLIEAVSNDVTSQGSKTKLEGVRMFASLRGDILRDAGVEKDGDGRALDVSRWYEADVTVIDDEVVCARVCDPAIGRPVQKCVCYADPSSWFGGSFAYMLRNVQALMNIVMASLKKQIQMATGPLVVYNDFENFIGAENPQTFTLAPWRQLFRKSNPLAPAAGQKPIDTVEFQTRIAESLRVIEAINVMADDLTGFPRMMFGAQVSGGALRTARGMAMAQEAANVNASWIIGNIDDQLVKRAVVKLVTWINMRYPDSGVKGDVSVVARGALGQVLETARRDEAQNLYAMVSRDGMLQQQLGPAKVLLLFRNMLETMGVKDPDRFVPSQERIEEMEMVARITALQSAMPQPGQGAQGGQPQPAARGGGDGAMMFQTGQMGEPSDGAPGGPGGGDVEARRAVA